MYPKQISCTEALYLIGVDFDLVDLTHIPKSIIRNQIYSSLPLSFNRKKGDFMALAVGKFHILVIRRNRRMIPRLSQTIQST